MSQDIVVVRRINGRVSPMNGDLLWSIAGISGLFVLAFFGWRIIHKEKLSRRQQ